MSAADGNRESPTSTTDNNGGISTSAGLKRRRVDEIDTQIGCDHSGQHVPRSERIKHVQHLHITGKCEISFEGPDSVYAIDQEGHGRITVAICGHWCSPKPKTQVRISRGQEALGDSIKITDICRVLVVVAPKQAWLIDVVTSDLTVRVTGADAGVVLSPKSQQEYGLQATIPFSWLNHCCRKVQTQAQTANLGVGESQHTAASTNGKGTSSTAPVTDQGPQ